MTAALALTHQFLLLVAFAAYSGDSNAVSLFPKGGLFYTPESSHSVLITF